MDSATGGTSYDTDFDRNPNVFNLERNDDGLWLNNDWAKPDNTWNPDNEFDHFMKRNIKAKYYIRYADDFVILHENKKYLENMLPKISEFLETHLKLSLHPDKVFIKTLASGVDFLGWIHFPFHRIPRTSTKKRMFRNLKDNQKEESLSSYRGLLSHGDTYELQQKYMKVKKTQFCNSF